LSKGRVCCFTGHRKIAQAEMPTIKKWLEEKIEELIAEGVDTFLCGGALGWDSVCGFAVLDFKAKYESIKLVMVLPCREQDKGWSEKDKAAYKELLAAADEIIYVSEEYTKDCMKKRNMLLVQDSDCCIAYMKYKRSGSAQTVRLANEKGIPVYNLAEEAR